MRLTEEQFELVSELASRFPFYGSIMTPSNRTFSCFSLDGFQGEDIKSRFLYAVNKLPSTQVGLNELLRLILIWEDLYLYSLIFAQNSLHSMHQRTELCFQRYPTVLKIF